MKDINPVDFKENKMKIVFISTIHEVDETTFSAFVGILNFIVRSNNIIELNRSLINHNLNIKYGSLSGHFHWSFQHNIFSLWQRIHYNSHHCFARKILEISFIEIFENGEASKTIHLN